MRERLRAIWAQLRDESSSPGQLAAAVFVGLFLGIVPLYGIQTPLVLLVAWALRLNRLTVLAAAQISFPPFAPVLIAAGIAAREFLRFGTFELPDLDVARGFIANLSLLGGEVPDLFLSCLLGDTVLGLIVGGIGAAVAYTWASRRARDPSPTQDPASASD